MNYFERLNSIDVSSKTEKKGGLTYLSWAWAWGEVKKIYPKSFYTIYENKDDWNYFTDGNTCWVKTGVTVVTDDGSVEHIEYLPVMDFKNKSIVQSLVTSFDVNKAIQRSLTKAIARHGLGLYIYAGEDLPEDTQSDMPKGEKVDVNLPVAQMHLDYLNRMLKETNSDTAGFLKFMGIEKLEDMTISAFTAIAKPQLEKKKKATK